MTMYMAVTADKYSLPVACEDTLVELADKLGMSYRRAKDMHYLEACSRKKFLGEKIQIIAVEVD